MIFTRTKEPPTGKGWVCVRVRPLTGNLRDPDGALLLAWEWEQAKRLPKVEPESDLFGFAPETGRGARKSLLA